MIGDELPLEVLRALAEPTRHKLYHELRASPSPLTTRDLAARTALHPNTVRAHLDLLCQVGLVEAESARDGGPGRPRHHFRIADRSPATPDPAATTAAAVTDLARILLDLTRSVGVSPDAVRSAGQRSASKPAAGGMVGGSAIGSIVEHERGAGFQPSAERLDGGRWRLSFPTCPYGDLARSAPDIVCSLHEGAMAGRCQASGQVRLETFTAGPGHGGCQVVLAEEDGPVPEPRIHSYAPTKHKEAQT